MSKIMTICGKADAIGRNGVVENPISISTAASEPLHATMENLGHIQHMDRYRALSGCELWVRSPHKSSTSHTPSRQLRISSPADAYPEYSSDVATLKSGTFIATWEEPLLEKAPEVQLQSLIAALGPCGLVRCQCGVNCCCVDERVMNLILAEAKGFVHTK